MAMKNRKTLKTAYGAGAFVDLPAKVGNVRIARLLFTRLRGGCSYCFPHGPETTNSSDDKKRRSWKHNRKWQYRCRDA